MHTVEKRFGNQLPARQVQWLTDNGAHDTRRFAKQLNLEACTIAVSGPQSNGMTMKEDYIAFMAKPDVQTALHNLAAVFSH